MNRRDFLQALGAVGVGSIPVEALAGTLAQVGGAPPVPLVKDNFSPDRMAFDALKVGIISVGGAACCMLPKIHGQLPQELVPLTRTLSIDTPR